MTADVNSLILKLFNTGLNYICRTEAAMILQFTQKDEVVLLASVNNVMDKSNIN